MRIQHNIASLNSYRNYTNNTNAVSKNLEKLSSGYRINRAGDDAAGLAISEKMRAQITGLEVAQKNAQDGISLVQTAEGALTEVHTMLNRMVELADQSANGTYDNEVDRRNLQKEVQNLKDEIDRIADGTNFNGINLLDGSLAGGNVTGALGISSSKITTATALSGAFAATTAEAGNTFEYTVSWEENGVGKSATVKFTANAENNLVAEDGTIYQLGSGDDGDGQIDEYQNAVISELKKNSAFNSAFDVAIDADTTESLKFTAKQAGSKGAKITAIGSAGDLVAAAEASVTSTAGMDPVKVLDFGKLKSLDADDAPLTAADIEKNTFTINGKKILFVKDTSKLENMKEIPSDVNIIEAGADITPSAGLAGELSRITGMNFEFDENGNADAGIAANSIVYKGDQKLQIGGAGLSLQIGDTSASFNQLNVNIEDTHVSSLGIASVDISTQDGAKAAVDLIKEAVNKVSDVRGTLGATQNRLEHTINNLSVTTENMTAAESRIRDVDVAKEMMSYTKNNILVQSAQAMLAQANQTPQGVLQLLQ